MKESFQQPNNPRRQKLLKPISAIRTTMALAAATNIEEDSMIKNIDDLRACLQTAIRIEHSTIPPYLFALYSIKDGTNEKAVDTIRSVVVEEMLHMILACNILNAIGGDPKINTKDFIPVYPTPLPDSGGSFEISLAKFSKDAIDTFLKIEKPAKTSGTPKYKGYKTIGQFYEALRIGLEHVDNITKGGIFTADKERQKRQITAQHYYGSGGMIVPVYSLKEAKEAIAEIVGQGEGIDDTIEDSNEKMFGQGIEYAHFFRFNELYQEQLYQGSDTPKSGPTGDNIVVDWSAVYDIKPNPKLTDYKGYPELTEKARSFNLTYTRLLNNIHKACNGNPELLMEGVGLMYKLKYKAVELMNIPLPNVSYMAGPTFEYEPL